MDDYRALRELLPAPPLSPEVERAGRELLNAAIAGEGVRRGRRAAWWSALGLGLAGAAAAAALVIVPSAVPVAPPQQQHSVHAAPDGKRFLLVAATSAASVPDSGTWWGSTLVDGRQFRAPGQGYVLRQTESVETWIPAAPEGRTWYRQTYLGAKPATPQDEAAWRADGAPATWTYERAAPGLITKDRSRGLVRAAPGKPETHSTEDWDFRVVLAGKPLTKMNDLPDTPEGLRTLLGAPDDRATVDNAARLLFFAPVSSETRAAAYRLLASLPGVDAVGPVTDALGRPGQAVEYRSAEYPVTPYPGETRTRLVIDPARGTPLSIETRSLADGLLLEFTAIQDTRWTNENPLEGTK
ncbi:CU044_5270 family protein [Nonomuraea sp. SYSU D8015]|uniref:CU044_5270 family protein n=1 Tax=Nonomuraea sp. SYSU D8015 TaxID=2593644 RepID=UPI0016617B10|nr:CU044_5270 family protein [Nonomuraea sp. SYSU D8015]